MENKGYFKQFDILRKVAKAAVSGEDINACAAKALESSAKLVGLSAASLVLWDSSFKPILTINHFDTQDDSDILNQLEKDLFKGLRSERKLISAYMSFGGERPAASFTLPIIEKENPIGAVMGIQPGTGSLVREDIFLEALSAALSGALLIDRIDDRIEKEKLKAVTATATAVNHGINNPLQAALGIVQLLPKEMPELSEKVRKKLAAIEESVLAITKITHKLMNISKVEYTDYVNGEKMLKLPDDENSL
jgi:signal transduction histidine kinase